MTSQQLAEQVKFVASGAAHAAPAVSFFAWLSGIPMSTWVGLASIFGLLVQAGYTMWKWRREWKRGRKKAQDAESTL